MADKSSSIRALQQELRQAGECLGAGDLEGAAGHVDAALAVDPSSLTALALRDRILRMRSTQPNAVRPGGVSDGMPMLHAPAPPGRFVPTGVDPQSWMSFEGRIEERRFRSLLRSAGEAIARGDVVAARIAVEEARELRPDADEVAEVSEVVAGLPIPVEAPVAGPASFLRSRTVRAAATLVFGVTLMLALDWLRSDPPAAGGSPNLAETRTAPGERDVFASVSRGQTDAPTFDRLPQPGRGQQPERPAVAEGGVNRNQAAPAPTASASTAAAPEAPVGRPGRVEAPPQPREPAVSARPSTTSREVGDDFVADSVRAAVSSASRTAPATRPPPSGEISGDFVAVPPITARSTVLAPTPVASSPSREVATSGPGAPPLANAVREPSPAASLASSTPTPRPAGDTGGGGREVTAPTGGASPSAAPAAAAAAIPRDPRSDVMTVVTSYTRALERRDARAAREIWPTVDERALSRSLNEVESQSFTFSSPCTIDVQGPRATASCRGSVQYVGKVGNREPVTEPRTWDIRLSRSGEDWFIDSVRVASR